MIKNLKSAPFKANVMKECAEVFYDNEFATKLDANKYLLGFKNGVYDITKHNFRPGRPEDYISKCMGVEYEEQDPNGKGVHMVNRYMEMVFPDRNVREYFEYTASTLFIGGNFNKNVSVLIGEGDNSKSVIESMIEKIFGQYCIKVPSTVFTNKKVGVGGACPELARAGGGVRLIISQEPDAEDHMNGGTFKEMSGNDTFFVRALYNNGGEINPMFKVWLICNRPPRLYKADKATWNRVDCIPFEATFCDDAPNTYDEQLLEKRFPKDPHFDEKIPSMLKALTWYLLQKLKLGVRCPKPEKVMIAIREYQRQNDLLEAFLGERLVKDDTKSISLTKVYLAYRDWVKESVPGHLVEGKMTFKETVSKRLGNKGMSSYPGWRLRTIKDDRETGIEKSADSDDSGDEGVAL
jgi:P4 family phage/plasmid primase-like protien